MNEKLPITELLHPNEKSIDEMTTGEGVAFFLEDQKKAIEAFHHIKNNLIEIIDVCVKHLQSHKKSRIIYTGAGTSGRIAVQDGVELVPTFGWPKKRLGFIIAGGKKSLMESIEGAEDNLQDGKLRAEKIKINEKDIVVALAASGNTPFTKSVLDYAKQKGALTVSISNNKNGKIFQYSDYKIFLDTGSEIIAGSTRLKAGTSQKICLNLMSSLIMTKLGFVKKGLMINLIPKNEKLIKRKKNISKLLAKLDN